MDVHWTEYVQTRAQSLSQCKLLGTMHNQQGEAHPGLCRVTDQMIHSLKQGSLYSSGITLKIYTVFPCYKEIVLVVQFYYSSAVCG